MTKPVKPPKPTSTINLSDESALISEFLSTLRARRLRFVEDMARQWLISYAWRKRAMGQKTIRCDTLRGRWVERFEVGFNEDD